MGFRMVLETASWIGFWDELWDRFAPRFVAGHGKGLHYIRCISSAVWGRVVQATLTHAILGFVAIVNNSSCDNGILVQNGLLYKHIGFVASCLATCIVWTAFLCHVWWFSRVFWGDYDPKEDGF